MFATRDANPYFRQMKATILIVAALIGSAAVLSAQLAQTEPNDSIGTATPSTLTAGTAGGIFSIGNNGDGPHGPTSGDSTGDFDFFSVDATEGQIIVFDVNARINGMVMDSVIGIYDSSGILLASNDDDGTTQDSFLQFEVPSDGTYYLVLGSFVAGATADAESLPTDPNTEGTGRGAPGGGIDDYEVVILLDGAVYFTHNLPAFPFIESDEVSNGSFSLTNEGTSAATITALNITGSEASAYSTSQELPLTVEAGATATIEVTFDPAGSNGVFEAEIEIVSDDIIHPTFSVDLFARAVKGLLFRLPFDDPAGSPIAVLGTPAETSGNRFQAVMIHNVGEGGPAPDWERPPLAGDQGFSTMFNDGGRSGNYVRTPNGFPHTATFTYSLWIRPTGDSNFDVLFNRDPRFSHNDNVYGCILSAAGAINFRVNNVEVLTSDAGAVEDDSIHHIVLTHFDSTGFGDGMAERTRLYIDGEMVAENTAPPEIPLYTGTIRNTSLWIGTRARGRDGFNGDMDDFQLYNIELDADTVKELFENPGTIAGEEPIPKAPFVITSLVRSADGNTIDVTFNSRPDQFYLLEVSSDLSEWGEAADLTGAAGDSTTISFTDSFVFDSGTTEIFFRVVEPEEPEEE